MQLLVLRTLTPTSPAPSQMFMSAAFLVQQLSKTPFTTFVTSSIFDALNMTSTTFDPIDSRHLSDSFMSLENGTVVEIPYGFQQTFENLQVNAGAGGVVTSAKDAVKWVEFLVRAVSPLRRRGQSVKEGRSV